MSRTLVSPRRQTSSRVWRSRGPRAAETTSLGRRNPRSKKRGGFIAPALLSTDGSPVNAEVARLRPTSHVDGNKVLFEVCE